MKYDTVFFDLDGTIDDSAPGIVASVRYALAKMGEPDRAPEELLCFIGPPLVVSFKTFFGLDDENADRGVAYYREYYKDKGIFEGYVYNGIEDTLKRLKASGKRVMVATSKPEEFAKRQLNSALM